MEAVDNVMVVLEETQHNSTSHSWCEVIAGVVAVAVAFLVGCSGSVAVDVALLMRGERRSGLLWLALACSGWLRVRLSIELGAGHAIQLETLHQARTSETCSAVWRQLVLDCPGGVACARRRGEW